jgi:steroid Delta-isomerase
MPSAEAMIAAVHAYVDGFEKGDLEGLVALFAPDASVEDPVGTPIKRGTEAIREFYTFSVTSGAKLELTGPVRCAGDSAAFPFHVKMAFGDQKSIIEVIDVFRFNEDGRIADMRAFWGPGNMKPG